jgi:hypothetical protein
MDGAETPQGVRKTALNSQIFGRQASFQKSRTQKIFAPNSERKQPEIFC